MEVTPSSPSKRNRSSPPNTSQEKPQSKLQRATNAIDVFLSKKTQSSITKWSSGAKAQDNNGKGVGRGGGIEGLTTPKKRLGGSGRGKPSVLKGRRLVKPFSRQSRTNLMNELGNLSDTDDEVEEQKKIDLTNSSEDDKSNGNHKLSLNKEDQHYIGEVSSSAGSGSVHSNEFDNISQELHEVKNDKSNQFQDADDDVDGVEEKNDSNNNGMGVAKMENDDSSAQTIIKGSAPNDLVAVDGSECKVGQVNQNNLKDPTDEFKTPDDSNGPETGLNNNEATGTIPGRTTFNADGNNSNEEDDINTQASEETVTGANLSRQESLPTWIRYRLIVNINPIPPSILTKKLKGEAIPEEYQNNDLRLLSSVRSFFCHIKSFDDTAMIIEWSSKADESQVEGIILPEALPKATSELQTFFDGFKGKDNGAVYLRIRIISRFPSDEFLVNCESWLKSNKCSLMRCPIQTEEATDIGFLAYTSQYNDKEHISKQLTKVCGHEIGVRLAAVANRAENGLDWRKKTKGLIVVAPTELAESAKNKLTTVFMARKAVFQSSTNNSFNIFHTLSFLPLEQDVAKMPNCSKNFQICLQRHQVHAKSIKVRFSKEITTNIHKIIKTPKGRLSMRQMILQIESNVPKTKGAKIFQSIDFISNSKKAFFPYMKKNGPGGEGYIFQFYHSMENEALAMIRGLGVYLAKIYSNEVISPLFSATHWTKNEEWVWNDKKKCFVTPDERLVAELVNLDSNAVTIGREATLLAHEEKMIHKKQQTPAAQMLKQQEEELIKLLRNPDLDPITRLDQPVQDFVDSVEFQDGYTSTTSSITDNEDDKSADIPRAKNNNSTQMDMSTNSIGNESNSTVSSTKTSKLRQAIDPSLTPSENRRRLKALAKVQMNRLQQREDQLLAELDQLEIMEEEEAAKMENKDETTSTDKEKHTTEKISINNGDDTHERKENQTASGSTTGMEK